MSDYKGAVKMIGAFLKARTLPAVKGYEADWFRDALAERKITACIPSGANRKITIPMILTYSTSTVAAIGFIRCQVAQKGLF